MHEEVRPTSMQLLGCGAAKSNDTVATLMLTLLV